MKNWFVILMLLLASFLWGTSFIATEMVLKEVSVLTTLIGRLGLAALILLVVIWVKDRGRAPITRKSFFYLVVLGLLSTSLYQWVQISANKFANASITSLFTSVHPMVLALCGGIFFKEKLGCFKISGILLGLMGSLYIATQGTFAINHNVRYSIALLLLILNSFMWASFSSLSKKLDTVFSSFDLIAYMTVIGFIAFMPIGLILAHYQGIDLIQEISGLSFRAVGALVFLSVFCTILASMLWIYSIRRTDMGKAGYYLYLEPVFAMAVAPFFVGNQINRYVLIGAFLIFIGLIFINIRKRS
ncbi:MAG: DMT family transporter [Desulfobacteraceae bacterium]|nr:MAG: DMT family transporter [Desulfobacteraceae bacterium]